MNLFKRCLTAWVVLSVSCVAFAEVLVTPNVVGDPYEEKWEFLTIEGFKVYVRPVQQYSWRGYSLEEREDERLRAVRKMTTQLKLAVSLLPPDPINELRVRVVFYMDDTCEWGDEEFTGKTVRTGKVYYSPLQSTDEHDIKLGQVSVRCFSSFVHEYPYKGLVMHELAHAWHDLFVPNGMSNNKIKAQFEWSKDCLHTQHPSYWKTDATEFFAEMTCSYFFRAKHMPYTDMSMAENYKALIKAVWKDPPDVNAFEPTSGDCTILDPPTIEDIEKQLDRVD